MSAANTTISFWGTRLTKSNTSFQYLSFSSPGFPEWGDYTVKKFSKQSHKTLSTSALSLCLSALTTLSTHFSATNIPTPRLQISQRHQSLPYFPSKTAYISCLQHQRIYIHYLSTESLKHMPHPSASLPMPPLVHQIYLLVSQYSRYQP